MNGVFAAIERKEMVMQACVMVLIDGIPFCRLPGARNVVLCSPCVLSVCCDLQAGWVGVAVALLEAAQYMGLL